MSKAILVIDIPDDLKSSYADLKIYETKGKHRMINRIAALKPLPQKKGKHGELNQYDTDFHYEIGWNDCIDEILGEINK